MAFWQNRSVGVEAGEVYRRGRATGGQETAQVMSITQDRAGIPHVRYRLSFGRPDRQSDGAEERTLALSAFVELYRERLNV